MSKENPAGLSAPSPVPGQPSRAAVNVRLMVMMFLQYYVWGAWFPTMSAYMSATLKFPGMQIGMAYGTFAIGAMISPFFVGMFADRFFAAEKILGVFGLLGAVVLFGVAQVQAYQPFYWGLVLYCFLFVPTLALGNSLTMQHVADAKRDFPRIKVASAIGWAAGSITVSYFKAETSHVQFLIAAAGSVAVGLYSLTLPHTPPKAATGTKPTWRDILGVDALALLRTPSFLIFVICMFLICIPLKMYHVGLPIFLTGQGWTNVAGKMAIAQISDALFLFVMPFMLYHFGFKKTILIGMFAWAVRYVLLAQSVGASLTNDFALGFSTQEMLVYPAIAVHGVCYDFLYIAGQLYVNAAANDKIRSAAQGLIAFILWGIGSYAGSVYSGWLLQKNRIANTAAGVTQYDWVANWMTPALTAAAIFVVFMIFFREPGREKPGAA